jgi:hypothetical protein
MSAASSRASADSTSASSAAGCTPLGKSSRTPTVEPSSPSTSPMPSDSRTCETSVPTTSHPSTSSVAASPAKTSASPVVEPESTVPARVFGPSSQGSLASFDPDTSSWRTSQLSLETSGLAEFSETWPRSGMTRSGTAYLLRPSAPLTAATGSGLLPTPVAKDDGKKPEAHMAMKRRMKGGERKTITSLAVLARAGFEQPETETTEELWPTPRATDAGRGGRGDLLAKVRTGKGSRRKEWPTPHGMPKPGQHRPGPSGNELGRAVNEAERWATPCASEARHGPGNGGRQGGPNLTTQVGGALNPEWVEWLMGFPIGWTALPPSATPSSRKSQSGSADASSTSSKSTDE